MNFQEFAAWLRREFESERLSDFQVADLLAQRSLFDKDRNLIEAEFQLKVDGYVANARHVADSTALLFEHAAKSYPFRMVYFEPIGYRMF